MITLVPMRAAQFEQFRQDALDTFARDNVRALRWGEDFALQRARAAFESLLPCGLATPGHTLCEMHDESSAQTVGGLWYALHEQVGPPSVYLYSIRVLPDHRGRGHATAAMELLRRRAADLGAESISLHAFAVNTTAQALYRSLGYGITGFNMILRLDAGGH